MSFKEMIKTAEYGFFDEVAKKAPPQLGKGKSVSTPERKTLTQAKSQGLGNLGSVGGKQTRTPMSQTQQYASAQTKKLKSGGGVAGFGKGGFQETAGIPHGKPGAVKKPGMGALASGASRGGQFQVASKLHTPFKKKASAKELIKAAQGTASMFAAEKTKALKPTLGGITGSATRKSAMGVGMAKAKKPMQPPSFGFGATGGPKPYGG